MDKARGGSRERAFGGGGWLCSKGTVLIKWCGIQAAGLPNHSICCDPAPHIKNPTFCVSAPPQAKSWIRPCLQANTDN